MVCTDATREEWSREARSEIKEKQRGEGRRGEGMREERERKGRKSMGASTRGEERIGEERRGEESCSISLLRLYKLQAEAVFKFKAALSRAVTKAVSKTGQGLCRA